MKNLTAWIVSALLLSVVVLSALVLTVARQPTREEIKARLVREYGVTVEELELYASQLPKGWQPGDPVSVRALDALDQFDGPTRSGVELRQGAFPCAGEEPCVLKDRAFIVVRATLDDRVIQQRLFYNVVVQPDSAD